MRAEGFELIVDVVLGYVVGFAVGSYYQRLQRKEAAERESMLAEAFEWLAAEYGAFELEEDYPNPPFWIVRADGRWLGIGATYDEAVINAWSRHLRRLYIEPGDADALEFALDRIVAAFGEDAITVQS